jgi:hypothetical protein
MSAVGGVLEHLSTQDSEPTTQDRSCSEVALCLHGRAALVELVFEHPPHRMIQPRTPDLDLFAKHAFPGEAQLHCDSLAGMVADGDAEDDTVQS